MPRRLDLPLLALLALATTVAGCAPDSLGSPNVLEFVDRWNIVAMLVVAGVWLWFFGGTVGSFLNVVAYRLPRGLALSHPGSFCPGCRTPIRWYDNLPVIGWLRLRGKCRACQAAISPRYPLVEALLGCAFLLLAAAELLTGGASIPVRPIDYHHGSIGMVFSVKLDLVRHYLFHCWLTSLLLAWALMAFDRQPTPRSLLAWGLAVGLVCVTAWPHLHPIAWRPTAWNSVLAVGGEVADHWSAGLASGLAGLTVGALAGAVLGDRATGMLAVIGVHLGWQTAFAVAAATAAIRLPVRLMSLATDRPPSATPVYLAMTAAWHVLLWRSLASLPVWPGPQCSGPSYAGWIAMLLLFSLVDRRLHRPVHAGPEPANEPWAP